MTVEPSNSSQQSDNSSNKNGLTIALAYLFSVLFPPIGLLMAGYLYLGKKELKHAFIVTTLCILLVLPWQYVVGLIFAG
ncbi:hypothetical protein CKO15_11610 [Halorhodospira abdelmalekii]|nr:hypothetical protein [Halorhodospira abdelmalekii]